MNEIIQRRVSEYFTSGRYNCAMTSVTVLSELFDVPVHPQVVKAGQVMPTVGGTGGLCGLVSGALMFVGVWGGQHGLSREELKPIARALVTAVEERFHSVDCRDLRPDSGGCTPVALAFFEVVVPVLEAELERALALRA
jgi:C_GCAxxG_C_C family probable redox protein